MRFFLAAIFACALVGCGHAESLDPVDNCLGTDAEGDVTLCQPSSSEGFQLAVPEFDVPAGHEVQDCHFYRVPADGDVFVERIQIAQNSGSHHMNIFRVASDNALSAGADDGSVVPGMDGAGECFNSANWSDWPLVINSQQSSSEGDYGDVDWTLPMSPRGQVVEKFEPGELLMLQTHFVNATTQTSAQGRGKVLVNFYYADAGSAGPVLTTIFATHPSIEVRPDIDTPQSFDASCAFSHPDVTIVGANSHFHSRGTDFTISTSTADGEVADTFYDNKSWDDPLIATDLSVPLAADLRVLYTCTYAYPVAAADGTPCPRTCTDPTSTETPICGNGAQCNKGSAPFEPACANSFCFGGLVETMEHCNAFVYLYANDADPAFEGSKITCF